MPERPDPESTSHPAEQRRPAESPADLRRRPADVSDSRSPPESSTQRWAAFITQAARVLASSLDFRTTVDNILGLAVPQLADWCVASVADDQGRTLEVAARHRDPVRDELLHEIVARHRFDPGRPFLTSARDPPGPVLVREATDAELRAAVGDEQLLSLVRALAPASIVGVPLVAHSRAVGAITLVADAHRARYDRHDLARLTDFAGLAALAVENCLLYRAVGRELVEHALAEEQLARSLALNQSTLEATADGLLVVDTAGRILSFNRQFLEMWRIPEDVAAAGRDEPILSLVLDQLRRPEEFRARVHELYATPEADSFDVLEFRDGRIFERYSRPHRAGRELGGRVWSFRDVTERTQAARLQHLLAEASTILAASLDYGDTLRGIARAAVPLLADWCRVDLVGEDGRLHAIAEASARPAGAAAAAPGDEGRHGHAPPARSLSLDAPHPAAVALRTGEPVLMTELDDPTRAALRADRGDAGPLDTPRAVLAVPLVARGRRVGAMTFGLDAPGRRHTPAEVDVAIELARRAALAVDNARLYEAALIANQAKSDFLTLMSHELRTPLSAIMGYAELLADEVSGPVSELQRGQLKRIDVSAHHLLELIEQILSFSRIEAGRESVHAEPVDVRRAVGEAVMMHRPAATKKGLQVASALPDGLPPLHTDPGKLRQILASLLANAVKFTGHGRVEVEARAEEGGMRVRVSDTGIGIAPEHLERIFDPFWQVEQPRTRRAGGTGLGLSVTRHLARLLGGDVEVTSRLGEGSTFSLFLPSLDHPACEPPATGSLPRSP
jgi:signal transduction histidine kinase/PAS domain-containing protein